MRAFEDVRGQLAEMRSLDPYDQPVDVLAALTILLPGWPTRRWVEQADLIEQQAIAGGRACRRHGGGAP